MGMPAVLVRAGNAITGRGRGKPVGGGGGVESGGGAAITEFKAPVPPPVAEQAPQLPNFQQEFVSNLEQLANSDPQGAFDQLANAPDAPHLSIDRTGQGVVRPVSELTPATAKGDLLKKQSEAQAEEAANTPGSPDPQDVRDAGNNVGGSDVEEDATAVTRANEGVSQEYNSADSQLQQDIQVASTHRAREAEHAQVEDMHRQVEEQAYANEGVSDEYDQADEDLRAQIDREGQVRAMHTQREQENAAHTQRQEELTAERQGQLDVMSQQREQDRQRHEERNQPLPEPTSSFAEFDKQAQDERAYQEASRTQSPATDKIDRINQARADILASLEQRQAQEATAQSGRVAAADQGRGYNAFQAQQERTRSTPPSTNEEVLRQTAEQTALLREQQRIAGEVGRRGYSSQLAENQLYQDAFRQLEQESQERVQQGEAPLRIGRHEMDGRVAQLQVERAKVDQDAQNQAALDLRTQVQDRQTLIGEYPELANILIPIEGAGSVQAQMQAEAQTEAQNRAVEQQWDQFVDRYYSLIESGRISPENTKDPKNVRAAIERRKQKMQQEVENAALKVNEERKARRREQDRQRRTSRQDTKGQVNTSQAEVVPPSTSRREAVTQFVQTAGESEIGVGDLTSAGQTESSSSPTETVSNAGLEAQGERGAQSEVASAVIGTQEENAAEPVSTEQRLQRIEVQMTEMAQENARLRQVVEALIKNPDLIKNLQDFAKDPSSVDEKKKDTMLGMLLQLFISMGLGAMMGSEEVVSNAGVK